MFQSGAYRSMGQVHVGFVRWIYLLDLQEDWGLTGFIWYKTMALIKSCSKNVNKCDNRACHPGGHYWVFYPGTMSLNKWSLCKTFEDQWLPNFIYECPMSKRVAGEIWLHDWVPGGCFTNVSRALQKNISKFVYCKNHTSYENLKLKLCMCAQSHALGTRTNFQLEYVCPKPRTNFQFEILTINVIFGIVYFREIILKSSRKVSETTPGQLRHNGCRGTYIIQHIFNSLVPECCGCQLNQ